MNNKFEHHKYLQIVANEDVRFVLVRDTAYGASWKASGGRSAWFNLARKIDRLKELMKQPETPGSFNLQNVDDTIDAMIKGKPLPGNPVATRRMLEYLKGCYTAENIFAKIREDTSGRDGSVLAEIRDLRRYLLLVEAEMMARSMVENPEQKIDGLKTNDYIATIEGLRKEDPPQTSYGAFERTEQNIPGTPENGGHHGEAKEE